MAKSKKLRNKGDGKNCSTEQNCNISSVTDNVEFANEPFDNSKLNKKENKKNKNKC